PCATIVAKQDESFGLENPQCLSNRDEARPAALCDLLRQNLGVAPIATGDDSVAKVFDNVGDGTVV
ncbi:MAG: hypothetical protein RL643_360, partial [Actinomycetota bacterium]